MSDVNCWFRTLSADFVAGAALSQGQVHFVVAGTALSQGQVQITGQAQHFRKVNGRFRGRCSTLARSSTDLVAGAAIPQSVVETLWQAQYFRKVGFT